MEEKCRDAQGENCEGQAERHPRWQETTSVDRSEVLGLRWQDVDLNRDVLHVRQGLHWLEGRLQFLPPKTRRSRRTVPLPSLCVDALREHRARQDKERVESLHPWPDLGLVFVTTVGTPIDPNNFSRTFARWCREAGVPAVRLHDLRHTCVSMLLTLGVNPRVVMEIVGHAALEHTDNHLSIPNQTYVNNVKALMTECVCLNY